MAHSWTGNTVTMADWENFWLNEGFTMFLERKAIATLRSKDFAMVDAYIGAQSCYEDQQAYGLWNSYSALHPNIGKDTPDNSFSLVPYEKGFQFLHYIESVVGDHYMNAIID